MQRRAQAAPHPDPDPDFFADAPATPAPGAAGNALLASAVEIAAEVPKASDSAFTSWRAVADACASAANWAGDSGAAGLSAAAPGHAPAQPGSADPEPAFPRCPERPAGLPDLSGLSGLGGAAAPPVAGLGSELPPAGQTPADAYVARFRQCVSEQAAKQAAATSGAGGAAGPSGAGRAAGGGYSSEEFWLVMESTAQHLRAVEAETAEWRVRNPNVPEITDPAEIAASRRRVQEHLEKAHPGWVNFPWPPGWPERGAPRAQANAAQAGREPRTGSKAARELEVAAAFSAAMKGHDLGCASKAAPFGESGALNLALAAAMTAVQQGEPAAEGPFSRFATNKVYAAALAAARERAQGEGLSDDGHASGGEIFVAALAAAQARQGVPGPWPSAAAAAEHVEAVRRARAGAGAVAEGGEPPTTAALVANLERLRREALECRGGEPRMPSAAAFAALREGARQVEAASRAQIASSAALLESLRLGAGGGAALGEAQSPPTAAFAAHLQSMRRARPGAGAGAAQVQAPPPTAPAPARQEGLGQRLFGAGSPAPAADGAAVAEYTARLERVRREMFGADGAAAGGEAPAGEAAAAASGCASFPDWAAVAEPAACRARIRRGRAGAGGAAAEALGAAAADAQQPMQGRDPPAAWHAMRAEATAAMFAATLDSVGERVSERGAGASGSAAPAVAAAGATADPAGDAPSCSRGRTCPRGEGSGSGAGASGGTSPAAAAALRGRWWEPRAAEGRSEQAGDALERDAPSAPWGRWVRGAEPGGLQGVQDIVGSLGLDATVFMNQLNPDLMRAPGARPSAPREADEEEELLQYLIDLSPCDDPAALARASAEGPVRRADGMAGHNQAPYDPMQQGVPVRQTPSPPPLGLGAPLPPRPGGAMRNLVPNPGPGAAGPSADPDEDLEAERRRRVRVWPAALAPTSPDAAEPARPAAHVGRASDQPPQQAPAHAPARRRAARYAVPPPPPPCNPLGDLPAGGPGVPPPRGGLSDVRREGRELVATARAAARSTAWPQADLQRSPRSHPLSQPSSPDATGSSAGAGASPAAAGAAAAAGRVSAAAGGGVEAAAASAGAPGRVSITEQRTSLVAPLAPEQLEQEIATLTERLRECLRAGPQAPASRVPGEALLDAVVGWPAGNIAPGPMAPPAGAPAGVPVNQAQGQGLGQGQGYIGRVFGWAAGFVCNTGDAAADVRSSALEQRWERQGWRVPEGRAVREFTAAGPAPPAGGLQAQPAGVDPGPDPEAPRPAAPAQPAAADPGANPEVPAAGVAAAGLLAQPRGSSSGRGGSGAARAGVASTPPACAIVDAPADLSISARLVEDLRARCEAAVAAAVARPAAAAEEDPWHYYELSATGRAPAGEDLGMYGNFLAARGFARAPERAPPAAPKPRARAPAAAGGGGSWADLPAELVAVAFTSLRPRDLRRGKLRLQPEMDFMMRAGGSEPER